MQEDKVPKLKKPGRDLVNNASNSGTLQICGGREDTAFTQLFPVSPILQ